MNLAILALQKATNQVPLMLQNTNPFRVFGGKPQAIGKQNRSTQRPSFWKAPGAERHALHYYGDKKSIQVYAIIHQLRASKSKPPH